MLHQCVVDASCLVVNATLHKQETTADSQQFPRSTGSSTRDCGVCLGHGYTIEEVYTSCFFLSLFCRLELLVCRVRGFDMPVLSVVCLPPMALKTRLSCTRPWPPEPGTGTGMRAAWTNKNTGEAFTIGHVATLLSSIQSLVSICISLHDRWQQWRQQHTTMT